MVRDTTELLKRLRACMQDPKYVKEPLQAYIIPTDDSHQSEYIADADARRSYISGFTGSAGTAVVTLSEALLWTDGRYYLQASLELDKNWTLMKDGLKTTPSIDTWLVKNLPTGSKVGVDATLLSHRAATPIENELDLAGDALVSVETNLVDAIWDDKPARPNFPAIPHPIEFAGKSSADKLKEIRVAMKEKNSVLLVVTALDEIAWLLNLRGCDIAFNPVFFAYVSITPDDLILFIDSAKIDSGVKDHFVEQGITVNICPYEDFYPFLKSSSGSMAPGTKAWVSPTSGHAVSLAFQPKYRNSAVTPILIMKAIKNKIEQEGMVASHVRDAAALCVYFAWLEEQVKSGKHVTEISGATELESFRRRQKNIVGLSFETISAFGPHGSIVHFKPSPDEDLRITDANLYLCDSGAQFLDGTTDVTRTMHFGTPTEEQKRAFTRVFKGQTTLGALRFPAGVAGNALDAIARAPLWSAGLDYKHGTGHGVGAYLNVHEGPSGITFKSMPYEPGLQAGTFLSNEPGYYKDGEYGIRLENIVHVVEAEGSEGFLRFDTITLVPIQTKMLDRSLLDETEIKLLNEYHARCLSTVGPLLEEQGETAGLEWLRRETAPF